MSSSDLPPPATTSPSQKRKLSTADAQQSHPRPAKRRASKACACCRSRKVRCNVVENGIPCTNCRLDGVECVIMESRRRRRPQASPSGGPDSAPDALGESNDEAQNGDDDEGEPLLNDSPIDAQQPGSQSPQDQGQKLIDRSDSHVPHLIYQTQGRRMTEEQRAHRLSLSQNRSQPLLDPFQTVDQSTLYTPPNSSTTSRPDLPKVFRPLPAKMDVDDVEYLTKKGALILPPPHLRTELLRCFVQYVHPYMPILDLKDFLTVLSEDDASPGKISLLLYQAVMFVGSSFVDIAHLHAAGFASRKAARKALFQRTRLLYDFDYETDRVTLLQVLLFMTYWYENPEDQKDTWHWMGISISIAHTIGLNRDPTNSSLTDGQKRLWKRIWWSIYVRDRLIALGMRRPARVQDWDCNVPMLTLDDFETNALPAEVSTLLGGYTCVQNQDHLRQLAVMFIEKAKLGRHISHVLSTQYSVLASMEGGSHDTSITLVPRLTKPSDLQACDAELEEWLANLPLEAQYQTNSTNAEEEKILLVHRALLKMLYLTTSSALHRPQVLPANPKTSVNPDVLALSKAKVRAAAIEITDIASDLLSRDLIKYLPTVGLTVLLPAFIVHLLDFKNADESTRTASLYRFYQCMQVLAELRNIYPSAEVATTMIQAGLRKASLSLPNHLRELLNLPQQQQQGVNDIPLLSSIGLGLSTRLPQQQSLHAVPSLIPTLTPPPENVLGNIQLPTLSPETLTDLGRTPNRSSHSRHPSGIPADQSSKVPLLFPGSTSGQHAPESYHHLPHLQQQQQPSSINPSDLVDSLFNVIGGTPYSDPLLSSPSTHHHPPPHHEQPHHQHQRHPSTATAIVTPPPPPPPTLPIDTMLTSSATLDGSDDFNSAISNHNNNSFDFDFGGPSGGGVHGESTGAFGLDLDMIDMKALDGMMFDPAKGFF